MKKYKKCIVQKLKNGYYLYFFKITTSSAVSLPLLFLRLSLSFKITDYNEKRVVSNKSLSLKATATSVDQKQPRRGVL